MTNLDYRTVLFREADRLSLAGRADLRAPIVHCEGWTVADLIAHVTEVFEFWTMIATGAISSPAEYEERSRVADSELTARLEEAAEEVAGAVYGRDPSIPVWTWSEQKDIGFIQRRMAHEVTVHRWDGENAVGDPAPIERDFALDGIDEFLTHFLAQSKAAAEVERVQFVATDLDTTRTVHIGAGNCEVVMGNSEHEAVVRADTETILLLLWNRTTLDGVDVVGDRATVEHVLARTNLS
jgi:uncharacterized protein (TIGR03083 family)